MIEALNYVLIIITGLSILHRKKDPIVCLGWLCGLFLFPVLTSLIYLSIGMNPFEGLAIKKKRSQSLIQNLKTQKDLKSILEQNEEIFSKKKIKGFLSTTQWISSQTLQPTLSHFQIRVLVNASEAYREFEKEILKATKTIYIHFYQILPDGIGKWFLELLSKKVKEGVKVCVLYDAIGSYAFKEKHRLYWQNEGLNIAPYLPIHPLKQKLQVNWRNHRKILVIDDQIGFTGGLNIGEPYIETKPSKLWHDIHFKLTGEPLSILRDTFAGDWHFATGEILPSLEEENLNHNKEIVGDEASLMQIFPGGPIYPLHSFHSALLSIIYEAKEKLWFSTPYFVPDQSLIRALGQACHRGVDVRIMVPYISNHRMTDLCSMAYFEDLIVLGLKIYRYEPGINHAKFLLADKDLILTGSSNLDYRSFFLNFELDLLIRSVSLQQRLKGILEEGFQQSRLVSKEDLKQLSFIKKTALKSLRLLSPLL